MKRVLLALALLLPLWDFSGMLAQTSLPVFADSVYCPEQQEKRPWRAAAEVFGINAGVWAFDRYILNADFAKISAASIRHNVKNGFVWDNDQFSTNLFAHPYHGSLYFNAARSNGCNFLESAPYALAGSLMWEIAAEVEPPAINDLVATTVGGIALGEVTHRLSSLVLDDSKQGGARFWRELLATAISPIRGLNRMINGEMWRVKHKHHKYHNFDQTPVRFSIGLGSRYLADDSHLFTGEHNPSIDLRLQYGDAFNTVSSSPYDYFTLRATFGLSGNQPLIQKVNLMGKLWDTTVKDTQDMEMKFGVYQHFNYFDSKEVLDGSNRVPYRISEAASLGPGIICRFPRVGGLTHLEHRIFLSGILLGGGLTDHYNIIDRDYNMGSGYSLKNQTILNFGKSATFALNMDFYRIFSWKGYEGKDLTTDNPLYLNAQGDKGRVALAVVNPLMEVNLTEHLKSSVEVSYFYRVARYAYHEDVKYRTFETRVGLVYEF